MGMSCMNSEMTPLDVPELVAAIISFVDGPQTLLHCAQVNRLWNNLAIPRLYEGSMNDMRFRSPDIGSLNSLLVASRERFARNMSFVKHLTLCSNFTLSNPSFEDVYCEQSEWGRHVCREQFKPFIRKKDIHYLVSSNSKMLKSISIPFEIHDQPILGALRYFTETGVKSLTVDSAYFECDDTDLTSFSEFLSQLDALTFIISNVDHMSGYEFLEMSRLKVFHIQSQDGGVIADEDGFETIIRTLASHDELEAFALRYPHEGNLTKLLSENRASDSQQLPWPNLRAVYLTCNPDTDFIEVAPQYKQLQIISIHTNDFPDGLWDHRMLEVDLSILTSCKQLRVLEIVSENLPPPSIVVNVAQSCPHLQRLSILRFSDVEPQTDRTPISGQPDLDLELSLLLQALPNAEIIELGYSGDHFDVFAITKFNPRLKYFRFPHAEASTSLGELLGMSAAPRLELLEVDYLSFSDASAILKEERLEALKAAWTRVFPRMCEPPCEIEKKLNRIFPYDIMDSPPPDPTESETRALEQREERRVIDRKILFYIATQLGYRAFPRSMQPCIYLWQTEKEIEVLGWPIVPWQAYARRRGFSSPSWQIHYCKTATAETGYMRVPKTSAVDEYF